MISVQELHTWVSGLDTSGFVGIDDGGLTLVEVRDDEPLTGAYLEVGGCEDDTGAAPQLPSVTAVEAVRVNAPARAAVISVADLLGMVGGSLTRTELPQVRDAIRKSSIGETLGDVVFSVITARQRELTGQLRAFTDPDTFTGRLGQVLLSSVPGERIGGLFAEIEEATGLSLMRVCCGEAARLCVQDRGTGRLFDLGDIFELWLRGDLPIPGPTTLWIGEPVEDFTRDELTPTGPHDYRLPEPAPTHD
ncbi:hypothetical protein [Nocardia pseudovaccinii]|uniref:hypothetical protein n=1 Tax=Nocardia pseudovaccinii TaxID=189540 RepID=UPI0007A3857D|nr:hypothetical protein [Nocardia pseudovaccinii]